MDKQPSKLFIDIWQSYPIISSYLTQSERINLHSTNSTIRQLTSNSLFWPWLQLLSINSKYLNRQLQWFSKNLRKFKPLKLTISIFQQDQQYLTNIVNMLMQGVVDSIISLDIFCESADVHLACSLTFCNLQQLTIRSKCVNNQLVQFMMQNLKKLNGLIVVKNDMEFTCKNMNRYIKNSMQKLIIKPYVIQFQQVAKVIQKSANTLRELEIDVEECSQQQIIQILAPLLRLEKLRLYHLEYLSDDKELFKVLQKQQAISQFVLTKAYNMELNRILQTISSKYLLCLDITDSKYVYDNDIKNIAKQCINLKQINISWCNGITCQGLQILFQNCLKLQHVNITGIKQSKDIIFGKQYTQFLSIFNQQKFNKVKNIAINHPQIIQKQQQIFQPSYFFNAPIDLSNIKMLRKLKYLDCNSCNSVSDNILKIIFIINRTARTYNYYGNYMGLFPKENQSTFC